uniref:Uncharacterized protein n=1 Tax=Timema cristinae TaxID=61476 RepID=A0A7R9DS64_TIMCR|nr:unnamed protein product [Timema cristinae]
MCGAVLQDQFLPPSQRTSYDCEKTPTGPLDRKKLIEHINKQAMETPDIPEHKPYVAGTVRGKKKLGTQQMNHTLIQSFVLPISGPQDPKCNTWINKLPLPSDVFPRQTDVGIILLQCFHDYLLSSRSRQWIPPPQSARERNAEEQIAIDLGDEYETALTDASQEEIIDLAGGDLDALCGVNMV